MKKHMKPEHKLLHKNFQEYGSNAREWMRKCILLLPEIDEHRIWEQKGFKSLSHYAAVLAGMSYPTCTDGLRILKRTANMPNIRKLIEDRGIGIVRPLETILTLENEKFWTEKARKMSKHTLEMYVREYRKLNEKSCPGTTQNTENQHQQAISKFEFEAQSAQENITTPDHINKQLVGMYLEPAVLAQLEKLKGNSEWNELMKEFLSMRSLELEEQKPLAVETDSRHIPNAIQRHVKARDNGRCAFPGCKNIIDIKHHTARFALEKIHDPDKIYGLCKEHERIAHLGLIENEDLAPQHWKIGIEADKNSPKFEIDEIVSKFRTPKIA